MNVSTDPRGRLDDGNALFRKNIDPGLLQTLAKGQTPFYAFLSCSDSRVDPVKIFNLSLGDAFVVRIAGNSCADQSVIGSLEYAVKHLGVRALIVLGHTGCGAVRAALETCDIDSLHSVMRDIDTARYKLPDAESKNADVIAEANVRIQLRRLEDSSSIIRDAHSHDKIFLCGAMYDLRTGSVKFI